jgi:oligopeptide/dipeptide ABC transporter ATP-binding protein
LDKLLEINNLKVYFFFEGEKVEARDMIYKYRELKEIYTDKRYKNKIPAKAVDDLSFEIYENEIFGIAGESGAGKSVTAHSIMRLIPEPIGKIISGKIYYGGRNLLDLDLKEFRKIRGKHISMIFQEPMSSLNPVLKIQEQIIESILIDKKISKKQAKSDALEFLRSTGINNPDVVMNSYPHQLSGGIRQRIMIAIALSRNPSLLIADEPTTSLDVTIQKQILDLLFEIKENRKGFSILLITHNLGIIRQVCDRMLIMYAGKVQEKGTAKEIFENPKHPYTVGLLSCFPDPGKFTNNKLTEIPGVIPNILNYPGGCKFHPRCKYVMDICKQKEPELIELENNHSVRCHLFFSVNKDE